MSIVKLEVISLKAKQDIYKWRAQEHWAKWAKGCKALKGIKEMYATGNTLIVEKGGCSVQPNVQIMFQYLFHHYTVVIQ